MQAEQILNFQKQETYTETEALELLNSAEASLDKGNSIAKSSWFDWLDVTSRPEYLIALGDIENRERWAEVVFKVIQQTEYSLKDLFEQRLKEQPLKVLFQDMASSVPTCWSYEQVNRYVRQTAAVFHRAVKGESRVAIFSSNSYNSAICDLACLMYDIFDTPLNIHFTLENLKSIFERLEINIVVVDTKDRAELLLKVVKETGLSVKIFAFTEDTAKHFDKISLLDSETAKLSLKEIETILSDRPRRPINQVGTTMFTSGSTGIPKGVSFSIYNLVSKRFARHAAVPKVGKSEVMLCYLPLFHTFGRYLELLGSIYWRGTYVFAGNPSSDTLLALFPKINPSLFISIPLRWQQLYEKSMAKIAEAPDADATQIMREVTGSRLHWGLSAAGYLPPSTFLFFQKNGIELCSGFGMTEATGGITMTPPGDYISGSVGKPLPGTNCRLTEIGELEIGGHYITRYLEDAGPDDIIAFPGTTDEEFWLPTGDIFQRDEHGHYEIIDRVKDIYKNNKGQTVAPRTTEKLFADVPGVKRAFLVGDGKPYNTLFIVPENEDPMLVGLDEENKREYFHRIIMEANRQLAPYERVINFKILHRDFEQEKKELTAKGTFNRKTIILHFAESVEELYISNHVTLDCNGIEVVIPRWFYRDLGLLEDDIVVVGEGIYSPRTDQLLTVKKGHGEHIYQIGNLKYTIYNDIIDLGVFARQPRLWVGNPSLIDICPVKEGWDLPLKQVSPQVFLPKDVKVIYNKNQMPDMLSVSDPHLIFVNEMVCCSLHTQGEPSYMCTKQIGDSFNEYDEKLVETIRRRLEALSRHPEERVRALAYRILLLQDPKPDYSKLFPTFIQSGLSFLNEESIQLLANYDMGKQHLESLRQRLYYYRTQLEWPATNVIRKQFDNILKLLFNFASKHVVDYYSTIRGEFASWVLHQQDPELSSIARRYFRQLFELFEDYLILNTPAAPVSEWDKRLVFDEKIPDKEVSKLKKVLVNTRFLKKTIILVYNEKDISLYDVPEDGIWITKIRDIKDYNHYRISINTIGGKHFDLHFMVADHLKTEEGRMSVYWHAAIASHPYATKSLPALGCYSVKHGALANKYVSDLTVAEKVRAFAGLHNSLGHLRGENDIRKVYIKAIAEFFKVWHHSGYQIVPGNTTPGNVVVPELDYLDSAILVSIAGFSRYQSPISIIEPLVYNFYKKISAFYPWLKEQLKISWIFDAANEVLSSEKITEFLKDLKADLEKEDIFYADRSLLNIVNDYREHAEKHYYVPLALYNAIDKYKEWKDMNPFATPRAKEETIYELSDLYKLLHLPEVGRLMLYRHTYFTETPPHIREAFDRLLEKMSEAPNLPATRHIQLSYLQDSIIDKEDLEVFSKMVFPRLKRRERFDILKVGAKQKEEVIIQNYLQDRKGNNYTFREPIEPHEIGQLYHLFFEENYPKSISEMDQHFIVLDEQGRVIGGLCYIPLEDNVVLLDGAAVSNQLKGRGIGTAMIEAFSTRMAADGIKAIKAHFLRGNFYLKLNFKVDKKWGALVKFL